MPAAPRTFRLSVPATTANLGPGYDALGLALSVRNHLDAEVLPDRPGSLELEIEGEGAGTLPRGASHLLYRALVRSLRDRGVEPPGLRLRQVNRVPLARGMGSSAAALVAGLALAARLLDEPDWKPRALALATEMEGHPDNVAPALLGGLVACGMTASGPRVARLPLHPCWRVALAIPGFEVSTAAARARLPQLVPHGAAAHNLSRLALLLAALQQGEGDLEAAVDDQLHQPYRAALVPGFRAALDAAREAGAPGAFLSGSGSTVAALVDSRRVEAEAVARAMASALEAAGSPCGFRVASPDPDGARFEE